MDKQTKDYSGVLLLACLLGTIFTISLFTSHFGQCKFYFHHCGIEQTKQIPNCSHH